MKTCSGSLLGFKRLKSFRGEPDFHMDRFNYPPCMRGLSAKKEGVEFRIDDTDPNCFGIISDQNWNKNETRCHQLTMWQLAVAG
jgi:hypothetical protein